MSASQPVAPTGAGSKNGELDLDGPIHIIGTGLLGTSIGLALVAKGYVVWLSDANHEHARTAVGLGAGRLAPNDLTPTQLVVVAVPPDHIASTVVEALEASPAAIVTDVGSVKSSPLDEISDQVGDDQLARYVGGHPMAGSERSGPLAASASLFEGRPWAVTPDVHSVEAAPLVEALVRACGAEIVRLSPREHDHAVARTSHLPQLLAVLTAGQLTEALPEQLKLSGQGVRDVTRIAASDPDLWTQILLANRDAVDELLANVQSELVNLRAALDDPDQMNAILAKGVAGTRAIPGKHGGQPMASAAIFVAVPDHAGELHRLFAEIAEIGVNIEDVRIDHDPARDFGLVEVQVEESQATGLAERLSERGWSIHR
ncbi:MAG: prephenate dehydrogenase [Nocardioidaceae bacterium]